MLLVAGPSDAQKKKKRHKKPAPQTAPAEAAPTAPASQPPPTAPKSATPPAAATNEDNPDAGASTSGSAAATAKTSGPAAESPFSLLELSVGLRGFQRHLSYNDDIFGRLPAYDLSGAPAGRVGVAVYPLRTPTFSAGLLGSFEYAFALGSTFKKAPDGTADGTKYSTSAMQYAVGLRANLLVGGSTLFGGVDYLSQSFTVGLPEPTTTNASVPDVKYTVVRPNIGARIGLADKFALLAGVGYLLVLDAGQITSNAYFPKARASVSGIDLNLGVAYALSPHLELRPIVDYRRFGFKFKPATDDPYIAGGALDQYLGVSVNAAYLF